MKCLAKDPRDRYPSAAALAEDLRAYRDGGPVLADASTQRRLLGLLLRETRHAAVLGQWGHVWMWHAVQIFLLFLATNILIWSGIDWPLPHLLLWAVGLASLLGPIWYYRFRGGLRLTPIEQQLGQVWGMFIVAALLTGFINHIMGLAVFQLLPLVVLECGFAFGCMAAILGGSFYGMAVACVILALVMAWEPRVGPVLFGAVFAVGLFVPGWKHSHRSPRKA